MDDIRIMTLTPLYNTLLDNAERRLNYWARVFGAELSGEYWHDVVNQFFDALGAVGAAADNPDTLYGR